MTGSGTNDESAQPAGPPLNSHQLRAMGVDLADLGPSDLIGTTIAPATALEIIRLGQKRKPNAVIHLSGVVKGDLEIPRCACSLQLAGVDGAVAVSGAIDGFVDLANVSGRVFVASSVERLRVTGQVGEIHLIGEIATALVIAPESEILGDVVIGGPIGATVGVSGLIRRNLRVQSVGSAQELVVATFGKVGGDISIEGSGGPRGLDEPHSVGGNVRIDGRVAGGLTIDGDVGGRLSVTGFVGDNVTVASHVGRGVYVGGRVGGAVELLGPSRVGDTLELGRDASVGSLSIAGGINGDVRVSIASKVDGGVQLDGEIDGDVQLDASATVGEDWVVSERAHVAQDLQLSGTIGGSTIVGGAIDGRLTVNGAPGSAISLRSARCADRVALTPATTQNGRPLTVPLVSVAGSQFRDEVFIGDGVDLSRCDFRQCPDIDKLALVGADLFTSTGEQPGLGRLGGSSQEALTPPHEMATIYRQLRTNLEERRNSAATGPFYRGEMSSRLADARATRPRSGERWILELYRAMSDYGLSARRALAWFVGIAVVSGAFFASGGLTASDEVVATGLTDWRGTKNALLFSVQSMVAFVTPPSADLGFGKAVLQLALRFAGPLLLAQAFLAVRNRVRR